MISIWFFIGISLAVNGALICAAGIYQVINPPVNPELFFSICTPTCGGAAVLFAYRFALLHKIRSAAAVLKQSISERQGMATKKMTMGLIVGNRGFFPITWPRAAGKKCCGC